MNESPPAPLEANGPVLTPGECRQRLIVQIVLAVPVLLIFVCECKTRSMLWASASGVGALMSLVGVAVTWRLYAAVRGGSVVMDSKGMAATLPTVPTLISVIVVLALTVVVIAALFLSVMIWSRPQPANWRPIIVAVNGGLWFFTLFCWVRLFTTPRKSLPTPPAEVDPGAWPPPPRAP